MCKNIHPLEKSAFQVHMTCRCVLFAGFNHSVHWRKKKKKKESFKNYFPPMRRKHPKDQDSLLLKMTKCLK